MEGEELLVDRLPTWDLVSQKHISCRDRKYEGKDQPVNTRYQQHTSRSLEVTYVLVGELSNNRSKGIDRVL